MMKYPIGVQTFEEIRTGGYVYVDKTEYVFRLADEGKYYFLSRPRRFGKSLLLSTMEAYFQGRKELFEGLAMEGLEKDWREYPVLRLDLGGKSYRTEEDLSYVLNYHLEQWECRYGKSSAIDPDTRFRQVIDSAAASTGNKVVILVDEYDKPIVDNLGNKELREYFRSILQGFYSVMKAKDDKIRFGFLTGVSRIGHLNIFSGLNNLKDISMDAAYDEICGVSEENLRSGLLSEGVEEMAEANKITVEDCYARLKSMYDGYHFHEESPGIYNPYSLLLALSKKKFGEYWYVTATPSFLVSYLMRENIDLNELTLGRVRLQILTGANSERISPVTLLYQTGYLTFKEYFRDTDEYLLGYPNKEVENGFTDSLAQHYIPKEEEVSEFSVNRFAKDLREGDVDLFLQRLKAFFADNYYQVQGKAELYMQNTMYVFLKLLGQRVEVERHTSNGRIDILIQTEKYVYIIELKRDKDPSNALDQIESKGYAWPFIPDNGRKIYRIGINFSTSTRRIEDWKVE